MEAAGGNRRCSPDRHAGISDREGSGCPADRPLISSVFHNRLKMGMKLDCDPTTVYAAMLEGRYSGKIHQSDLASPNAYNTYQHAGLPPGPIASPGDASLRATRSRRPRPITSISSPVRMASGSHQFSKDIAAHRQAATQYRRGIAK